MKNHQFALCALVLSIASLMNPAVADVSSDQAEKLNATLTPLGGEKSGNASGTIPAWTGGLITSVGQSKFKRPGNIFSDEKPMLQITAENAAEHGDKLSAAALALLEKYPSYKINVFPTHRTVAAPQSVYDNTLKNAVSAKLTEGGKSVGGAFGGIPFPIPNNGLEVIWNHILHPRAASTEFGIKNIVGSADGRNAVATRADNNNQSPYYKPDGISAEWDEDYLLARFINTAPPFKAGEALVIRDSVNVKKSRQAWQYLVGQRRVRRAPTVAYDTPDFVASGANYFDEVIGFYGAPDRYEWKLIGKKEMYIPYNNNGFFNTTVEDAFVPYHPNPEKLRWELHRVWEVEATLASGQRHVVPKRTFYFDEDNWAVSMIDGYDASGKLWRGSFVIPFVAPEYPMVISDAVIVHDLQAETFSCVQCANEEYWRSVDYKSGSFYTGDALSSSSLR